MNPRTAEPWLIHFFQRHPVDDSNRSIPAIEFLDQVPVKVRAELLSVVDAVAQSPPPSFAGGGKWEAMHGAMAGFFEVRVQRGEFNYRLLCRLERPAADLGGPSLVCIDGLRKPKRSKAADRDYRRIRRFGAEFDARRTVARLTAIGATPLLWSELSRVNRNPTAVARFTTVVSVGFGA